jgi:thiol-disulfide isomerase/thioredoxin
MPRLRSPSNWLCCLAGLVSLAVMCGCEPTSPSGPANEQTSSSSEEIDPAGTSTSIPIEEVRLEVVDGDGYEVALAKQVGSVVLVDFWATWCEPCTEKFPHIVELHHKHKAEGLRVMSFACNELSEEASVKQFLAEQGASFDNLLTKFGNGTETNDTFGIHGVPYYKLYDRQGKLRYQFAEIYDDLEQGEPVENIDRRVAELLAETP